MRESGAGFTLLETIIYIALFTIIIGGGMVAAYQIIQATDANYNHIVLQQEANFLFRKISWALTGATINTANTSQLVTTKVIATTPVQLTLAAAGNDMTLQRDSASPVILNSASIVISNLLFTDIPAASGRPRGLETSFTLATNQNGRPATQDFSFTKYMRQ